MYVGLRQVNNILLLLFCTRYRHWIIKLKVLKKQYYHIINIYTLGIWHVELENIWV